MIRASIEFIRYVPEELKPGLSGIPQFATDTEEALFLFDEVVAECL